MFMHVQSKTKRSVQSKEDHSKFAELNGSMEDFPPRGH